MQLTLKQFVFQKLKENDGITDSEIAKFCKGEPNWYTIQQYSGEYHRLERDRNYYRDKEIVALHHYKKKYTCKVYGSLYWTKISKQYFEEIKKEFKKDNSRPDLKEVEMYYK